MVEATRSPVASALRSAITASWPGGQQRAQSQATALQTQRADDATYTPQAIFNRNFAGPGVVGDVATRPAFRVGQLDTELLDEELLDLLKQQLWGALKYFRPTLKETFEPELMAILRAALFKLTIWDNNATYGAALQNLKYIDARSSKGGRDRPPTRSQKILYGLITVGGRYLYARLNLWLLARSNPEDETPLSKRLSDIFDHLTTIHSFATLFSFLLFLKNGHHRTILDRVLRLRLAAPNHMVAREVSFEYLNRQLVWHAFTEFLLFILPVVRVNRWRRWYSRFIRKARSLGSSNEDSSILKNRKGELAFLPEKTCAICYKETTAEAGEGRGASGASTDITNPYEALPCGHLYCYICITSKIALEEGEGWECLRCNTLIKKCRPWKGGLGADFSDEVPSTSVKKVGFEGDDFVNGTDSDDEVAVEPADDDIPTPTIGSERQDDQDLAKLTETLVDELDDDHHPQYNESLFTRNRPHSPASGSGSEVGPLGESYDHISSPPAIAVTYESDRESQHTERGGPRDVDEESVAGTHRARSPMYWITEDDDQDNGLLSTKAELADHDSVYDTAGEEDEKEGRKE
ncbi:Pex12 amino terminal region-domain-containing protein [Kalaharituber pfeilii]|nr:Pex12 amino terminal region-domain-containing protein [Kalaharituber pfeilii]